MIAIFASLKASFKNAKRCFTGETLRSFDVEIGGGFVVISILLRRERKSLEEYFVLKTTGSMGGYTYLCAIELEEFDQFIEAAEAIRAYQTSPTAASPYAITRLGRYTDLVVAGEVLKRIDIGICAGCCTLSLRLKRERKVPHEYVVFACMWSGHYNYFPFDLDEFHRFVAGAKRLRALVQSPPLQKL